MTDFYVYISSAPTKRHSQNVFSDFRITLPHQLNLKEGKWSMGVCDVTFKESEPPFPNFYLCSDLIQSNFDSTTSLPILRLVHGTGSQSFAKVYYCALKPNLLDNLHFYLKPVYEVLPSVKDKLLFCTLHFKHNGQLGAIDS